MRYNRYTLQGELSYNMTQVGAAERMAWEWEGQLAWCDWLKGGKWIVYGTSKPGVWVIDDLQLAMGLAVESARRHQDAINRILEGDGDERVSYLSYPVMKNIMGFAKTLMAKSFSDFDQNPWVLNCPTGPLDLEVGAPVEIEPADYMCQTRVSPRSMPTPLWDKHLMDMTHGDVEIVGYLKRLAGMSLCGDQNLKPHKSVVMNGLGRNGKGVFTQVMLWVLGDYGGVASSRLLTAQEDAHTTEQRRLAGKRLVVVEEVKRIQPSLFKNLTGGGRHSARDIRENDVEFLKSWTFWFNNNGAVSWGKDTSDGLWERLTTIDFGKGIEKRIDDWTEQLKREAPGILQWMIDGCFEWQEFGLQEPISVGMAGLDRRQDADPLSTFLEENYQRTGSESDRVSCTSFMTGYTDWCKRTGESVPGGRNTVNNELRDRLKLTLLPYGRGAKLHIIGLNPTPVTFGSTQEGTPNWEE